MLDAARDVVICGRVWRSNPFSKTRSHLVPYEHVRDITTRNDYRWSQTFHIVCADYQLLDV
jgi:hypothetical protein